MSTSDAPANEGEFSAEPATATEFEYKLVVPPAHAEVLWRWLQKTIEDGHFGPGLSVEPDNVVYLDTYYDHPDLKLMARGHGLRHRIRLSADYAEVIQLKSETVGKVARQEQSFPVWSERFAQKTDTLTDKIVHEHRPAFRALIESLGFSAKQLTPILSLHQERQRFRIEDAASAQARLTISLDDVVCRFWWETYHQIELEIELERDDAQPLADSILAAIRQAFPELCPDQTSKFRKAYAYFNARYIRFPQAIKAKMPVELIAGAAVVTTALSLTALLTLFRKR